ncbi:MAG: 2-C-methyl-D-erythritol 2,4-cyclodiphosphate synthase, partial [uncultured Quadrisphaera sp.]
EHRPRGRRHAPGGDRRRRAPLRAGGRRPRAPGGRTGVARCRPRPGRALRRRRRRARRVRRPALGRRAGRPRAALRH